MPIYAYRCASCGHAQDVLRKLSDPPLTICPACSAQTFEKQLTAAGFQLKGSGWYVTDFRDKPAAAGNGKAEADKGKTEAGGAGKIEPAKSVDAPASAAAASTPAPAASNPSGSSAAS